MIHKIKALYNQGKGLSIRAIARELKISRNTVRKYLAMDEEGDKIKIPKLKTPIKFKKHREIGGDSSSLRVFNDRV